jgi:putative Holliday junction resolvase
MGLDVGERRIGVALGDPSATLASPLTTVIRSSDRAAVEAIGRLAAEHGVEVLVVGLPLDAAGQAAAQARRVEAFARRLRAVPDVRVVFWDERFSTRTASESLLVAGTRGGPARSARQREAQRRRLDAAAAAVILQDYLDQQRTPN